MQTNGRATVCKNHKVRVQTGGEVVPVETVPSDIVFIEVAINVFGTLVSYSEVKVIDIDFITRRLGGNLQN